MSCQIDVYGDVHRSILNYCSSFLDRNVIQNFQIFDFDAHATIQELPNSDLLGVSDYAIENQQDIYVVTCMFVVCTKSDDAYLKRLRPVVAKLFSELRPSEENLFKLIDENGLKQGTIKIMSDVAALPIGNTKNRPVQAIAVSFSVGYNS